jgi:cytidylate kinase
MNPHSLERQVGALERAQRHWQEQHGDGGPAAPPAFTLALTREAGTPGTTVAREVGARLGWAVYDHELLQRISQEKGLRVSLLESVDERQKGWLTEAAEAFAAVPSVTENTYVRYLIETVLSLGAHGHCVIVGRGSAHILPADRTLRVRLVAHPEDRISATARRLGCPPAEAKRWVEETDRERARFIKTHFLKDPTDPLGYDLVLNTSRWSVPECADLIVQALRQLQARARGR